MPRPPLPLPQIGRSFDALTKELGYQIHFTHVEHLITDILVVEFDRALFQSPCINLDLVDGETSRVLETKLGSANFWNCPHVLEVSSQWTKWNQPLLELLRVAETIPSVFVVIITGRTRANEPIIQQLLKENGINKCDLVVYGEPDRPVHSRKLALVEALWRKFSNSATFTWYEGRPRHAESLIIFVNRLKKTPYGRDGAFTVTKVTAPLRLLPPRVERKLIEHMISASAVPPRAQVVVTTWRYQLQAESKVTLVRWAVELCESIGIEIRHIVRPEILICKGPLPYSLKNSVRTEQSIIVWKVTGYAIRGSSLVVYLTSSTPSKVAAEDCTDHGAASSIARVANAEATEFVPVSSGPEVTTFTYRGRKLIVRAGSSSMRTQKATF